MADGQYLADFDTDSSMFRINEMYDNKGLLTVKDGKGTIYIVMPSTKIQQLYLGLAEDAKKDGAELIEHTVESVTYDDGLTEDANAFEVPVPVLDEEFDLALIGEKGKWYDHKVKVSNPVPAVEEEPLGVKDASTEGVSGETADTVNITLEGGTGKASIKSPAEYTVKDDAYVVRLEWSSPHYDYMIVDGEKYIPVNTEGNSVFEIPFKNISEPVTVIADTTAMSAPHEIEYTISFN
ncbi:MAG: iron transporter [Lachnospiraceae bacterium]|nr:iron transporter [Lachnospiraceae bacterium]